MPNSIALIWKSLHSTCQGFVSKAFIVLQICRLGVADVFDVRRRNIHIFRPA